MAVIFSAPTSDSGNQTQGQALFSFTHTGGDILLAVGIGYEDDTSDPTYTFDGSAFTLIGSWAGAASHNRVALFILRGKAAMTADITPTFTQNKLIVQHAFSVTGLVNGTPYRTASTVDSAASTALTDTLSGDGEVVIGDVVVAAGNIYDTQGSPTLTPNAPLSSLTNGVSVENSLLGNRMHVGQLTVTADPQTAAFTSSLSRAWTQVTVALIPQPFLGYLADFTAGSPFTLNQSPSTGNIMVITDA